MRKLVSIALLFGLLALSAAYVAFPFWTAWSIREAVRSGNSDYLARKIEWESVRRTLRASMAGIAFDMPDTTSQEPAERPGFWKRVKAYVGGGAVNKFVDTYVTPEGLPKLFEYRQMYRRAVSSVSTVPDEAALTRFERFKSFWSRLVRAEFKSLTAFEVELEDRHEPTRHHVGLLELKDYEWKLTELRLRLVGNDATEILATDR
jgi:hypothetical protein